MATVQQRDDLRWDLSMDTAAISDAEIDRAYERSLIPYPDGGDTTDIWARLLVVRALITSASRRVDYTQNQSSEKLSQIFKNLRDVEKTLLTDLNTALNDTDIGVQYGALRRTRKRVESYPADGTGLGSYPADSFLVVRE